MARSFADWKYFKTNVQQGLAEGRYVNAAFTLLAAGPARLSAAGVGPADAGTGDFLFPIGVVQNFNLGQQSSVMRLFEIGSERSYMIRGRTVGNLGLGRILYHGPSLLRTLYSTYKGSTTAEADLGSDQWSDLVTTGPTGGSLTATTTASSGGIQDRYQSNPGEGAGNLWLNLASDVFSQPVGLALFMKDSNADTVGAFYFEYCMVTNHGFSTEAGSTIISENASITFEKMIPLSLSDVSVISDSKWNSSSNVIGSAL